MQKQQKISLENAIAYWHVDPDFEKEISKRIHAAQKEGREYAIDAKEAKDIIAAVGKKPSSEQFKQDLERLKELDEMNEEQIKEVIAQAGEQN